MTITKVEIRLNPAGGAGAALATATATFGTARGALVIPLLRLLLRHLRPLLLANCPPAALASSPTTTSVRMAAAAPSKLFSRSMLRTDSLDYFILIAGFHAAFASRSSKIVDSAPV
jgi:hypothetical protein